MKENYDIHIKGIQTIDGEKDNIEFFTSGSLVFKNNKKYIVYREYDIDNPKEKLMTVLSLGSGIFSVKRPGNISDHLILERKKRHTYLHHTDMGDIKVGVFTYELKDDVNETGGDLYAKYTVDFNAQISSYNELFINIKEKKNCTLGDNNNV